MNKNQIEYPSVTEILGLYFDKSKINPSKLEYAASRGSEVHAICAAKAKKVWVPTIPPDCAGYILSFQIWFDANVKKVIFVEEEFIDTVHGYKGHPDMVVALVDRAVILVDLKTPLQKIKIWRGQMAAYKNLIEPKQKIDRIGSLRLSPKGKPPTFDEYQDSVMDFTAFLAALSAFKYFT